MEKKSDILDQMIIKLRKHPDKYERMFAAQYLAKYSSSKVTEILAEALNDKDPDVVEMIRKFLKKDKSRKEKKC